MQTLPYEEYVEPAEKRETISKIPLPKLLCTRPKTHIHMKDTARFLSSRPFKFVVGKDKRELFLHTALLSNQSEALDRMINGPFAEARQGYAVLEDDDVGTVTAFAKFLYTGDYDLPAPGTASASTSTGRAPAAHKSKTPNDDAEEWCPPSNAHWYSFTDDVAYAYRGSGPPTDVPTLNKEGLHTDYADFFIAHAKIFVFADCYGADDLADLAMHKLHRALCGFRLSRARLQDVVALVRFCYGRGPDALRDLVASYAAGIVGSTMPPDCARELLGAEREFAADMAWLMACRLMGTTCR
ncbi:hypothetical protein E4U41_006472 [Claviceps citrina]|nr:hypothetical protein E4U41_006472 [Claviceps citrina]